MDTSNPMDLTRSTNIYGAFGCAADSTLMRAICSQPVLKNKCVVSVKCKITESGHGGPVMHFACDGSLHISGLIVESCEDKITLLPTKKLHDWLQHVLLITSNTSHFR
jgi:predicted oxidoreductase